MAKLVDRESLKAFRQANDERYAKPNGNYPTLTAGLADNLTPYSEDSGASQENPFISNGTGTNNNTEIVTVGDYGLLKEKQANTLVVKQLIDKSTFGTVSLDGIVLTGDSSNGIIDVNGTNSNWYIKYLDISIPSGHYVYVASKSTNSNIKIRAIDTENRSSYCNQGQVKQLTSGANAIEVYFMNLNETFSHETLSELMVFDITSWDADIIADLTANPSHFSWYYNGDLSYNTGTLVNASGVKLVSTGRNIYNPNETYNVVIPNKPFFASKTTTITYYDKDKNVVSTESVSAGNTFTTPSNCVFINSSVSAITITSYYTDQEGGEGYKDNSNVPIEYPYETPYVVDTGIEVLRKAGSVKDYKEPNGTIHRLVGTRAYQSGDENDSSLLTDETTTNYPLASEDIYTEQGTPFAENLPINDYGMLYWLDSSDELVGIPQGCKIFYPTNYKGFVDDMYSRVDGDSSKFALNEDLVGYVKQIDLSSQITSLITGVSLVSGYKYAYQTGKTITITLAISNQSGSTITAGTDIVNLGTIPNITNYAIMGTAASANSITQPITARITSGNNIRLGSNMPNTDIIYISFSYAVA